MFDENKENFPLFRPIPGWGGWSDLPEEPISNSDNLGATLDPKLLSYFAQSKAPFMMECCERTSNDKKGGHLASREGQLILREAAQCPDEDEDAFQDISKHRYFNTNNLWIDLEALKAIMTAHGGVVPLPMIKNKKTVRSRRPFLATPSPRPLRVDGVDAMPRRLDAVFMITRESTRLARGPRRFRRRVVPRRFSLNLEGPLAGLP